ncbi:hypothetical protein EZS27_004657 [termite gut metagenome]|uniref:Uncharacterized protein n=1 Tax=termite gut metagenome TaxID=433724 RepID=A0A5J4SPF4_9ZZZZ
MKNTKKEDKNTDKNIQVNKVVEVQVNDAGEKLITLSDNANFVTFSYPNLEVQLDMYVDIPDTFLGKTGTTGGTFAVMLNKYNNDSTFFDINNFISKKVSYKNDFLTATSWVDAGTVMPFRYETFTQDPLLEFSSRTKVYTSNIIFVANGYTRTLEDNDLELLGYVYDIQTNNVVTLLTSQPIKQYQEGQTEYLNFCLKDMYHGQGSNDNIGLQYNYYTYSGEEITSVNKQLKGKNELFVINTIQLSPDLSEVEEEFEKEVGYFTVGLLKESVVISNKLRYDVISNCSNKLQELHF